jgi:tagatose-6-phosphate ketose/aldose isomerase
MPDIAATQLDRPAPDECWTRREILQQPQTLRATQALLLEHSAHLAAFLAPLLGDAALRIVLTGAGTSSFIGASLAPYLTMLLRRPVEAIPTTDLVSAPHLYLEPTRPTLLVSFGRSGDSPESIASIEIAEARLPVLHHLILTCNEDGALAHLALPNARVVVLPPATHDRGFAMTSSFTALTYAALAIFTGPDAMQDRPEAIARSVDAVMTQAEPRMAAIAQAGFERIVYLGSGMLEGLAREASLKLLELTDGAIATFAFTPMGFRHGPKTILNARTLVVVFTSNNALTRRYDLDLIEELRGDGKCGGVLVLSAQEVAGDAIRVTHLDGAQDCDLLFAYIVPAQLLGLHASLHLKLTPDQPNAGGTVNRVVRGVRIHTEAA